MRSTAIFKARAANKTVKHHPRSLSASEEGVSAMAPSRASVRALRLVHTLHDMTEHVRSDTESLTLKLSSETVGIAVDAELLVVLPTLPGTIAFPPNLHQPPHHHSQTHHPEDRQANQPEDCQAGHWNLAIACAAPVAYAPNNASKYGALSGATCTNA